MGKTKKRWTSEEEAALSAGVAKYGTGKWKEILTDQHFSHRLINRSNVDLKDKWRNLTSNSAVPPQTSRRNRTGSASQIWRILIGGRSKSQIVMIIAIVTMLGLIGIHTDWNKQLPLMLTIRFLWLEIPYMTPTNLVKTWKDLKRFLDRLWRFYKWLQSFNQNVKVHQQV